MRYILEGEAHEIAKVLQENRLRVQRGLIRFTPFEPEKEQKKEEIPVTDSKEPPQPDSKEVYAELPKKKRATKSE